MDREIDITGMKFGQLTVLRYDHSKKGRAYYKCLCDCGRTAYVSRYNMTCGKTRSCGCLRSKSIRIVRGKFTRHPVTAQQIAWLEKHYRHTKNADIMAKLNMSEGTLHRLARQHGWTKSKQFQHKMQDNAQLAAAESHRLNGTYPPKGYVIPGNRVNCFKPGVTNLMRLGKRRNDARIAKAQATMREMREADRMRVKYGLPRLNNLNINGDSHRVHAWRTYLRGRGYIQSSTDKNLFYWNDDTKRSPKLEAGGNPFTFEPISKNKAV